jgi:hypothetical protein
LVTVDEETGPRTARFLFLGGTKHRTWQPLPIEDDGRGGARPVDEVVEVVLLRDRDVEIYQGVRCESGPKSWWAYVLAGHEPSRSDIIDAYPYLT